VNIAKLPELLGTNAGGEKQSRQHQNFESGADNALARFRGITMNALQAGRFARGLITAAQANSPQATTIGIGKWLIATGRRPQIRDREAGSIRVPGDDAPA